MWRAGVLSLAVGCGWFQTPDEVDENPRPAVLKPPDAGGMLGTWQLAPGPEEAARLSALDEILGGGPIPEADWPVADAAWLRWAAEVYARPPEDPDKIALQTFAQERGARRLTITPGALTLTAPSGSWTRAWRELSSQTDAQGNTYLTVETRDEKEAQLAEIRFEDPDHFLMGPAGKPDEMLRWGRVVAAP